MDTALWILQVLLAVAFFGAGLMKLTQPKAKVAERMAWANDFSETQLKLIGLVELLGAVGLILPAITRILPILTPLAAVGLVLTMIGAALTHIRRGEMPMVLPNLVLLVLAAIVAYGRFVAFPL